MSARKMHADEVDIDVALVRRLLAAQFPQWADLPVQPVRSAGTVNAMYRLGGDLAVRLPRVMWGIGEVEKEHRWLPRLAPLLPLAIPVPVAQGIPGEGYPFPWSVYRWLEGENATMRSLADPLVAATELAAFVAALHRIAPADGHPEPRGETLASRDRGVRAAIAALDGTVDADAATSAWEAALRAPAWEGRPVWIHGDLLPGNLLAVDGKLSAVIDFGTLDVGDPAFDSIAAWTLFSGGARDAFRAALPVDDAAWARGRGLALSKGLIALPYYQVTNPSFAAVARHTIDEVLADHD